MRGPRLALAVRVLAFLVFVGGPCWLSAGPPPKEPAPLSKQAPIADIAQLSFQEDWNVVPQRYSNATELIRWPADQMNEPEAYQAARIMIITEPRLNHDDAVKRLKEIDAEEIQPATFIEIGGWPALQRRYVVPMERRGPNRGDPAGAEMSLRVTTAIAFDSTLVRIQGVLQPGSHAPWADEMAAIGRSIVFPRQGEPAKVQAAIEELRSTPRLLSEELKRLLEENGNDNDQAQPGPVGPGAGQGGVAGGVVVGPVVQVQTAGAGSEIEVAVSADAQHVIVVSNSRNFATSNDGGLTFPTTGTAPAPPGGGANGDPSIAFGATGNFYFAYIGFPGAVTCSTGITRSTDNGQTFNFVANATICDEANGPMCFPDQEHIAADRWNLSGTNQDQVYSTWRDFSGGGCGANVNIAGPEIPSLVCSTDSGANWTPKLAVGAASERVPRITVGSDGSVYVIYRVGNNVTVNKFTSCDNGLNQVMGFPQTIAAGIADVVCPVPGLDRCNDGNQLSSHMIAVDDTNPNHVYAAYSISTNAGVNEDVLIHHSTDGGASWSGATRVNANVNARRFMPWICSTAGNAYLSWYDTRNAPMGQPDATDFYCGSASVDGDGNLVAGPEVRLSPFSDPLCNSGWPCAPCAAGDSESCPVQPQLAGVCTDLMGNGTGARCDFSDCGGANMGVGMSCQCNIGNGETCNLGGGCPKYGDYNGNACMAGNLYNAWASALTANGVPSGTGIDAYYTMKTVVNFPPEAACMPFDDIADGNCCITVDVEDIDNGSSDPNGPADIDTICITAVDGNDVGCQQSVQVCDDGTLMPHTVTLTITDMLGASDSCDATVTVIDQTPVMPSVMITSMEPVILDENCKATVTFEATIADNCCVDVSSISFSVQGTDINVGMLQTTPVVTDVDLRTFTGTFVVSDILSCPASAEITVEANDCADNGVQSISDSVEIIDATPPDVTCPEDITLERGDKLCTDDVQDWLDSFTATDNCSSLPLVYSSEYLTLDVPDADGDGISHTLNVPDLATVESVIVDLGITHEHVGDLIVLLTHDGTTVRLVDRPGVPALGVKGCDADNFAGVVLADTGETPIEDVCTDNLTSPPILIPAESLAAFNGSNAVGAWTLTVVDNGAEDFGQLNHWTLRINGALVLTNDAPPCGFPYDSTTEVTFTATDACNNSTSCTAEITILPPRRVDVSKKGSILVYPNVELKWQPVAGGGYVNTQDTFLSITNDVAADVDVHFLFVDGDDALAAVQLGNPPQIIERAHNGWGKFNWTRELTAHQSRYFSAMTGQPAGAPSFLGLDNGSGGPGRPDPESNVGGRYLRGFVLAWAVDSLGNEITWNHLTGRATIVDYAQTAAWEYEPYAYSTTCLAQAAQPLDCTLYDENGTCCTAEVIPGNLDLDGFQYDVGFNQLVLDFFAVGATPFIQGGVTGMVNTDLTVLPMIQDLRQDTIGPVTTKARVDVWNSNEDYLSNTDRCLTCWDQVLLANFGIPNNFLVDALNTDKGKARMTGSASDTVCDPPFCCDRTDFACQSEFAFEFGSEAPICSEPSPLLGTAMKIIAYSGAGMGRDYAGVPLVGQGININGRIEADLPSESEQARQTRVAPYATMREEKLERKGLRKPEQ